jgi:hypothetical protein
MTSRMLENMKNCSPSDEFVRLVQDAIPFKTLGLGVETKYHHCWPHSAPYFISPRFHKRHIFVQMLSGPKRLWALVVLT